MTSPITNYFDDGMAFFEVAEYEQAIDMFTKALRLSLGDLAETHLYRGISYAYLQAYDKAMTDFNIQVFDVSGKLVRTKVAKEQSKLNLDVSDLKSGIYSLRIDSDTFSEVIKFVRE